MYSISFIVVAAKRERSPGKNCRYSYSAWGLVIEHLVWCLYSYKGQCLFVIEAIKPLFFALRFRDHYEITEITKVIFADIFKRFLSYDWMLIFWDFKWIVLLKNEQRKTYNSYYFVYIFISIVIFLIRKKILKWTIWLILEKK